MQELIKVHLEFTKAKKQKLPFAKLRSQRDKIRSELEEKLKDNLIEKIELILDDCETLVNWEIELEFRINSQNISIESQKEILLLQIYGKEEEKVVELREKINQKELKNQHILENILQKIEEIKFSNHSETLIDKLISYLKNKSMLTERDQQIIIKINELIGIKRIFLNSRQATITKLQDCCNLIEAANIGKYANIEDLSKALSAIGKLTNNWVPLNIIEPVGEGIGIIGSWRKKKFAIKNSQEFQKFLTEEENNLPLFNKAYKTLLNTLKTLNSQEFYQLLSEVQPNLFISRYRVYEVATNIWPDKNHLETGDMKDAIATLKTNLLDLQDELKNQEQLVAKFNQEIQQQILVK